MRRLAATAVLVCACTATTASTVTNAATTTARGVSHTLGTRTPGGEDCGVLFGGALRAKGLLCQTAADLVILDLSQGLRTWKCSLVTDLLCWRGKDYSDASVGLSLQPLKPGWCSHGQQPTESASSCLSKGACNFVQGVRLALELANVMCGDAQRILYAYFNENNGGTTETHIEVGYTNAAGAYHFWVCHGLLTSGGGGCYDVSTIRSHAPVHPAFIWSG